MYIPPISMIYINQLHAYFLFLILPNGHNILSGTFRKKHCKEANSYPKGNSLTFGVYSMGGGLLIVNGPNGGSKLWGR